MQFIYIVNLSIHSLHPKSPQARLQNEKKSNPPSKLTLTSSQFLLGVHPVETNDHTSHGSEHSALVIQLRPLDGYGYSMHLQNAETQCWEKYSHYLASDSEMDHAERYLRHYSD